MGSTAKKLNSSDYLEHLYDETTDGYINIANFNEKNGIKNTRLKGLKEAIEATFGKEDTFITPNTLFMPERLLVNIRQLRALYIDVDGAEGNQALIAYKVFELAEKGEIPRPSLIVDSGRGVHFYWKVTNAPHQAIGTWQALEDFLYYKLKAYGADSKALDAVRVLRIPNTINSKNNKPCNVMWVDKDTEYSMYDLREKYLGYAPKQLEFNETKNKKLVKSDNKVIENKFFNSYSLHLNRAEDLLVLCKLRNYNLNNHRNMVIHCYAYWRGIVVRDIDALEKDVTELNNSFTDPLKETEIKAVLRCIPKVIDKFIIYENDIRSGIKRKVTKGMRDKEGYWYKNETLIERLCITPQEQKHLKTIIGIEEKYSRNNTRRREERRNEKGLTAREQQKLDTSRAIKELKEQGLKQKEIAEKLGISIDTVKHYSRKIKKV